MSATPDFVQIRGIALPFATTRYIEGRGVEMFDASAFDAQIAKNGTLPVLWDSHDAGPATMRLSNSASFFAGKIALMFSATVDLRASAGGSHRWSLLRSMTQRRDPCDQVSVGDLRIEEEHSEIVGGMRVRRVTRATIGHISVVRDAAYATATAAWPMHVDIADAPWRIQLAAEAWEEAKANTTLQAKRRQLLARAKRIVNGKGDGPGGDLSLEQVSTFNACVAEISRLDREITAQWRAG